MVHNLLSLLILTILSACGGFLSSRKSVAPPRSVTPFFLIRPLPTRQNIPPQRSPYRLVDMEKSFNPSSQLKSYIDKIKQKEKDILDQRKKAMSLISWT
jgi:hypothetical protein